MKTVQIKADGAMTEVYGEFTKKNIRKLMREITNVKKYECLYEWTHGDAVVQCYGCLVGKAGKENKHDLPPSGVKKIETLDNSDTQLLFNDIFMVKIQSNKYCDFLVDDYGLFYTLCFEGFDDCYSDDESDISDDDTGSLDKFILNDADDGIDDGSDDGIDDGVDGDDSINSDDSCTTESAPYSDDELDEDINNY
jgi:hypothetical protein